MFCKNCGNQINNEENNCSRCGAPVVNNNMNSTQNNVNAIPNNINNTPNNVYQNQNTKKTKSFGKLYLMFAGGSFACFFFSTFTSLLLRMNSAVPDNYTAPDILNFFQITLPIILLAFGWIPALLISSMNKSDNNQNSYNPNITPKKRTSLKIVLFVIGGFFVLCLIVGIISTIGVKKYECKSTQGNLTILYKDGEIRGHTAKNIEFDSDREKEYIKKYGLEGYLSRLKIWFESQTDGTCEYK